MSGDKDHYFPLIMKSIHAKLTELVETFDLLGDWEERYRYVIELGRDLKPLSDDERSQMNKVTGCASQVWLVTERMPDGTLSFRGDSDAHIVKGLIAVLLYLVSDQTPAAILEFDARAGFERLDLAGHLSAQRSNGLAAMVARIRRDAGATEN